MKSNRHYTRSFHPGGVRTCPACRSVMHGEFCSWNGCRESRAGKNEIKQSAMERPAGLRFDSTCSDCGYVRCACDDARQPPMSIDEMRREMDNQGGLNSVARGDSVKFFTPNGPRELVADPRVPRDMMLPPKQTMEGKIATLSDMLRAGKIMIPPTDIAELLDAPIAASDRAMAAEYAMSAPKSFEATAREIAFIDAIRAGTARLAHDLRADGPWTAYAAEADLPERLAEQRILLESGTTHTRLSGAVGPFGNVVVEVSGSRGYQYPRASVNIATRAVEVIR